MIGWLSLHKKRIYIKQGSGRFCARRQGTSEGDKTLNSIKRKCPDPSQTVGTLVGSAMFVLVSKSQSQLSFQMGHSNVVGSSDPTSPSRTFPYINWPITEGENA